ncbi:MAG: VOC family protein [Pseudomonadota bacterium]
MTDAVPPPIVPYLTVRDARSALAFYSTAFGGKTIKLMEAADGSVFHARTRIGEGLVMLYEEKTGSPDANGAPETLGGSPVSIRIELAKADAVDSTFAKAIAHGAIQVHPPTDRPWGRLAQVRDPEGHFWSLAATDLSAGA